MKHLLLSCLTVLGMGFARAAENAANPGEAASPALTDKTLVVWAAPANLSQQGGSALTLDDGQTHFDGVVFGELAAGRWMAGSDFYRRTEREQDSWPRETSPPVEFVQVAITYRDRQVTLLRNGAPYARYSMANPPQTFGPGSLVLFGRRHLDVTEPQRSFSGRIRDARIYDRALPPETIAGLHPGVVEAGQPTPWAWWAFGDEGLREKTGRFNELRLLGDVRIADGCLVLGGNGATFMAASVPEGGGSTGVPRSWSFTGAVPEEVVRSTRLLRERLLADPYRPGYHFCVPEDMGMPGDPNGAFYHAGTYHLMYLYSRSGGGFCWGHISSRDLVHWRHHPDAIGPGNGDEGCFSGGAFVDEDGSAWLSYWMLWGARGIGLARSSGPPYDVWTKSPANPVIRSTEWGITEVRDSKGAVALLGSADPSNVWKQNGRYHVLTGNLLVLNKVGRAADAPLSAQGDRLYLWSSTNLVDWEYRHVFYERQAGWTDRSEDNMCPSFLPLPSSRDGGPPSGKHLLLFISHNLGCQYYVGSYRDDRFHPDNHGRMTWVDNTFFAPEALIDGKGRQIMWAWLLDNPSGEKERGWSGVYGLPRVLWLGEDGSLRMAPVSELAALRNREQAWPDSRLEAGDSSRVEVVNGESFELEATVNPSETGRCGVEVRAAEDGSEATVLGYDAAAGELYFDATRSGGDGRRVVEKAPLRLAPGEALRLRVFVDRSVIEVFANDRQAISRRVYPTRRAHQGVRLFASGAPASFRGIRSWEMMPSNPY